MYKISKGRFFMNINWIIMPLSGAVIGYFTNWLAIKMLFRPLEEKKIGNFVLPMTPGLIPKERKRITATVAHALETYVLTKEALEKNFQSETIKNQIKEAIHKQIEKIISSDKTLSHVLEGYIDPKVLLSDTNWEEKAVGLWPVFETFITNTLNSNPEVEDFLKEGIEKIAKENLGSFLSIFVSYETWYEKIKASIFAYLGEEENLRFLVQTLIDFLKSELDTGNLHEWYYKKTIKEWASSIAPEKLVIIEEKLFDFSMVLLQKGAEALATHINVPELVESQLDAISNQEMEKIVLEVVNKELKMITWLGGVLGGIIGFFPLLWEYVQTML